MAKKKDPLQDVVANLTDLLKQEQNNTISKTNIRLRKGQILTEFEALAPEGEALDGLTPVQWAVQATIEAAHKLGVQDFTLSKSEVSTSMSVYKEVVLPLGGIDYQFVDHYALNPDTGETYAGTADDDTPRKAALGTVTLNAFGSMRTVLRDWINPDNDEDPDKLLSFLRRFGELGASELARYVRAKGDSGLADLIDNIATYRELNAETGQVEYFKTSDLREIIDEELNITRPDLVALPSIERATFNVALAPNQKAISLVSRFSDDASLPRDDKGNIILLHWVNALFNHYFNVDEIGIAGIIKLAMITNFISEEAAQLAFEALQNGELNEDLRKLGLPVAFPDPQEQIETEEEPEPEQGDDWEEDYDLEDGIEPEDDDDWGDDWDDE